jgi:pimeloyl-ACP methyl ester carboxylesterase
MFNDIRNGQSGFYSVEYGPDKPFRPFLRVSRISESALVRRSAALFTRLDPLMRAEHAQRVRSILATEYDQMLSEVPGLMSLPGVSDLALNQLCGISYNTGHYYAYVPPLIGQKKLGLWVFLHGNAGNLKIFTWRWRKLAEDLQMAVVAPTYGFGFWGKHSAKIISGCVEDACQRWPQLINQEDLWLAGLSDGGNGVTRGAGAFDWSGLVYLSATMRARELAQPTFLNYSKGTPVLVLHGSRDHNVWPSMVQKSLKVLQTGGVRAESEWYDGEDHFLTYGAALAVDERIKRWIKANRTQPESACTS